MTEKIKLVEFRDVGGLQNNNQARTQAIYKNFETLTKAIESIILDKNAIGDIYEKLELLYDEIKSRGAENEPRKVGRPRKEIKDGI